MAAAGRCLGLGFSGSEWAEGREAGGEVQVVELGVEVDTLGAGLWSGALVWEKV